MDRNIANVEEFFGVSPEGGIGGISDFRLMISDLGKKGKVGSRNGEVGKLRIGDCGLRI